MTTTASAKCPACRYFSVAPRDASEWAHYYECPRCGHHWRLLRGESQRLPDRRRQPRTASHA